MAFLTRNGTEAVPYSPNPSFCFSPVGRRSLPKTDPALDLGPHLRTFEELPRPWSAQSCFGRDAPLEVEVGSGKGLFLRTAATAQPAHNFLGIEIARKYAHFAAAALAKRGVSNAMVVVGDALRVFAEVLPTGALAAVHVYFPDPWWKKRHKKRRVFTGTLLADIERSLVRGGALQVATDVEEYFEVMLALVAERPRFAPEPLPELKEPEHDLDYLTNFERKYRIEGRAIFRASYQLR